MFLFDLSDTTQNTVEWTLKFTLNAIMGAQMLGSIAIFIKTIYTRCNRKNDTVIHIEDHSCNGEPNSGADASNDGLQFISECSPCVNETSTKIKVLDFTLFNDSPKSQEFLKCDQDYK